MSGSHAPGRRIPLSRVWGLQAVLVVTTLLTLYPVLWVLSMAFSSRAGLSTGVAPVPEGLTLVHFERVLLARDSLGNALFPIQLGNSLLVSAVSTAVGMAFATVAAYGYSRFAFPGKAWGMRMLLTTQMFPGVVMAIPLYLIIDALGLMNSMLGLALVYSTTSVPFCIWMLKGYFDTIPRELEEAAWMDGASRWMVFVRIVLPLARPALVVTALFSFMSAWNEFILAATFLSGERNMTLPVLLQSFVDANSTDWGPFAAGALLVSLPVMTLFFVLQRHLVGGLTAGGVKG
jgi:arabinogalactan oligomer/maltooligosaccharide transport system permease protein